MNDGGGIIAKKFKTARIYFSGDVLAVIVVVAQAPQCYTPNPRYNRHLTTSFNTRPQLIS